MLFEEISRKNQINLNWIDHIADTASRRYRIYEIAKHNGGKRVISQPSRHLKSLQRLVVNAVVNRLPVHASATAYRQGIGIRENASRHSGSRVTVRLDIENYFPTFRDIGVRSYLFKMAEEKKVRIDNKDIDRIVKIVCKDGQLTIGAPSSPSLTNAMMYDFDEDMSIYCVENEYIYSRYADDFFISSISGWIDVGKLVNFVRGALKKYKYASLTLNEHKTAVLTRKYKRVITGVVINTLGKPSLGRERKKIIKAKVHKIVKNEASNIEKRETQGLLAFAMDIEPEYIEAIQKKYGKDVVGKILRYGKRN